MKFCVCFFLLITVFEEHVRIPNLLEPYLIKLRCVTELLVVVFSSMTDVKVDYSFRNIGPGKEAQKPRLSKQKKEATAEAARKELASKIFGDFYSEHAKKKDEGNRERRRSTVDESPQKSAAVVSSPPSGTSPSRPESNKNTSIRAPADTMQFPAFSSPQTQTMRPATAPKRRPTMFAEPAKELPPWRSRGTTDREDLLIEQFMKISRERKWEWGTQSHPPAPTELILGPDNLQERKTIRSSHARTRFPKSSGGIANCKPYRPPEHYYPPEIRRSEIIYPDAVRDRHSWEGSTQYLDYVERAKPLPIHDVSPQTFHATFRPHSAASRRDIVNVTIPLDTIRMEYREKPPPVL